MTETIEQLHNELVKMMNDDFTNLKNYLEKEQPKGYLEFLSIDEKSPRLEFAVGFVKVLLIAEINIHSRCVFYKSFKLVLNTEDYPKEKLERINELDLFTYINNARKFRHEKTISIPAKFGEPNISQDSSINQIRFGELYVQQVINELNKPVE